MKTLSKLFSAIALSMLVVAFAGCISLKAAASPAVWVASGMDRVGRTEAPKQSRDIVLYAASGEYAPFQVIVRAPKSGLGNVTLRVSDLAGPRGSRIPRRHLSLYREHYIFVKDPTGDRPNATVKSEGPGWYADALIPFIDPATGKAPIGGKYKASPARVEPGQNQPYWVDAFVPRNAKPGKYTGTYTITSNRGKVTGKITLNVWNFTLPLKPSEGSMFLAWTDKSLEAMSELARHRIMPVRFSPEQAPYLMKHHGANLAETGFWSGADVSHHKMDPAPSVAACKARAARYPKGLRLINYTADEIANAPELDPIFREYARNLHQAGIEQLLVGPPNPNLFDDGSGTGKPAVDIWVLLGVYFDDQNMKLLRDAMNRGMEVWSYTTANQDDFSPKWQVDFAPINFRALPGFMNQSMGFTGILYWAVDKWNADPWTDINIRVDGGWYPGNATFVYPGKDIGVKGTVASMRMKWIREGMEDYEYVELLKKAGKKDLALKLSRSVAKDMKTWSQSPDAYEKVRLQMAKILSKSK